MRVVSTWQYCGHVISIALLTCSFVLSGCGGESGPELYEVTGTVSYGGKPIKFGDIRFEPQEGIKSTQTVAFSMIEDGKYTASILGGPHSVHVRDLAGDPDIGDGEGDSSGTPMFEDEYRGVVEFPAIDAVEGSGPQQKDIDVPTTHK